jgi:hypothetical protein
MSRKKVKERYPCTGRGRTIPAKLRMARGINVRAVGENVCSAKVSGEEKKSASRVERSCSQKEGFLKTWALLALGNVK